MTIPASKVRAVCTSTEVDLVRASRKGELEQLSAVQVKRLAVRARKQLEKWQDLGRDQSRVRSRKVGFGDTSENTRSKEEIFRETLTRFEARLAKIDPAQAHTAKKPSFKTKNERTAKHRSKRASVRKELTATERLLNAEAKRMMQTPEPQATVTPAPQALPAPVPPPKAASKSKPRSLPKALPTTKIPLSAAIAPSGAQRKVTGAAKKARLVSSGKTTRMPAIFAHVESELKPVATGRNKKAIPPE